VIRAKIYVPLAEERTRKKGKNRSQRTLYLQRRTDETRPPGVTASSGRLKPERESDKTKGTRISTSRGKIRDAKCNVPHKLGVPRGYQNHREQGPRGGDCRSGPQGGRVDRPNPPRGGTHLGHTEKKGLGEEASTRRPASCHHTSPVQRAGPSRVEPQKNTDLR